MLDQEATPDLHQTVWNRASSASVRVYRTALFGLVQAVVLLVTVPLAILLVDDKAPTEKKIAAPVLVGAVTIALTLLVVLVAKLALAPVEQRNDLRRAWPADALEPAINVRITLLDRANQGRALIALGPMLLPRQIEAW